MIDSSEQSKPELETLIRDQIRTQGGISFRQFMAQCLYHPQYGYYTGERCRIGKGGDFFTSSSVHALFGALIARQLVQMCELLGDVPFIVAEQGGGEGHLALDILDALRRDFPAFYERIEYRMVEISPDNRRRQSETLGSHGDRVRWCAFEDLAGMVGCFLSNELLDAMPVHQVEKQQGELREVFVTEGPEGLAEELRRPSTHVIFEHFNWLGLSPLEGNRAEVNLDAVRWMRDVAGVLARGFVLTIDYGYPAAELYAPFRRGGTLMCYHRHSSSDNPYERLGSQDITAHVDFTALQKAGEEEGLVSLYFAEQYRFLMGLGFVEELMRLQALETDPQKAQALRLTLKNLILPEGGMGETFKVLVQGKAVGTPTLACSRTLDEISRMSTFR